MADLLTTHTLTFSIPINDDVLNLDGTVTASSKPTTQDADGSLQHYNAKKARTVLPQGVRTDDVRVFYTQTEVRPADHHNDESSYTTVIDGDIYEIMAIEDWTGFDIPDLEHYKVYLVRRDETEIS